MKDSKLIKLLQSFTEKELKEFRKFIDSPFFNKEGSYLLRFFDEVKKGYPEFTSAGLAKEILFKKLYPEKQYNDATMRKLSSGVMKLAEEYLRFLAFDENKNIADVLYVKKLREKRLDKFFESEAEVLEKTYSETENSVDINFFRNRYLLELEKINYYVDFNSMLKKQQQSLQLVQDNLVYDSLINLLDIGFNILVGITTMFKGDTNLVLKLLDEIDLEKVSLTLKESTPEFFPVFELFYTRYKCFRDFDDDNAYYMYKDIALKNMKYLTWENQFTIFISLQNICTRKFVEGKRSFSGEQHELHKEMLKRGLYTQNKGDYMNIHTYRNIVLTAAALERNKWILEFMDEYSDTLLPEQREGLICWTKAIYHFNEKEFEQSLKQLNLVEHMHFLTKHEVKAMQMKIFYELKDYEPAISFAEAYRHMVSNDKNYSDLHRTSYTNFCIYYIRLIKLVVNGELDELPFLRKELEKTTANSKEWLIGKIDLLI